MGIFSKKKSLWQAAITDSSHYLISTLILKLISLLVIPLLTRNFSLEEFGIYDLFLSFYGFIFIILGLGLDSGAALLLTKSDKDNTKLAFLLVCSLVTAFILSITFMALSYSLLSFKNITIFTLEQWALLCLYITLSLQSYLIVNFCRFNKRVKSAAYANLVASIFGVCIGLYHVIYLSGSVTEYLYGLIYGSFVGLLFCFFIVRDVLLCFSFRSLCFSEIKELYSLSIPFVPTYIGNSLIQLTDRFIILILLDVKILGLYALASRISSIPTIAFSIISKGFLPVILRNYETSSGQAFARQFLHFNALLIPFFILISYIFSTDITLFFGGEEFIETSIFIPLMMCSVLVFSITNMGGFGYIIKKKTYILAYITYFSLLLNVLFSFVLGIYFGLIGILSGTVLTALIRSSIHIKISERLFLFGYKQGLVLFIGIGSFLFSLAISF